MCLGYIHAWGGGGGANPSICIEIRISAHFFVCARPPLFSSHVQAHNWVLVYKPNKDQLISVLDFCYTSKSKLFKTQNGFTHRLGP